MSEYTAISFAPVQGFIEKSRKLRDLFGASLILSHLSSKLVTKAKCLGFEVISPGLPDVKEGMPNLILVRGEKVFDRDIVRKTLLDEWQKVLEVCQKWVEENVPTEKYYWSQTEEQKGQQKGEWERWGSYTWEVFWGTGKKPDAAMQDLERRKLKRDWTAINWVGESSSLSGTDAIAWHQLGKPLSKGEQPGRALTLTETQEQKDFYQRLSQALETSSDGQFEGKFLDSSEKLSIPELVKRLVTRYEDIGIKLGKDFYIESFSEMVRLPKPGQPGHWTGWFMGDGDEVGKKLKDLVQYSNDTQSLREFSDAMRKWGKDFKRDFPPNLGRVVYAGGDDFLGVIYSKNPKEQIAPSAALNWLMGLNKQWNQHGQDITVSLGFVWAGHSIPQRDILQHCREAEKRAKTLGRNRVTIRVVFNSGQFVQWTCPWDYLHVLINYRDRDGNTGNQANWTHIYNDWEQLKARHAVSLKEKEENIDAGIALRLFDLYFKDRSTRTDTLKQVNQDYLKDNCKPITGKDYSQVAFIEWIDGLVKVGWQLCSNT